MEILFKHYGVDWLAMILMFISLIRLGDHQRDGFVWGLGATIAWAVFNGMVESVAGVIANAIYFLLNLRGWVRWKPRDSALDHTNEGVSSS